MICFKMRRMTGGEQSRRIDGAKWRGDAEHSANPTVREGDDDGGASDKCFGVMRSEGRHYDVGGVSERIMMTGGEQSRSIEGAK